jgi:hypothetical protein
MRTSVQKKELDCRLKNHNHKGGKKQECYREIAMDAPK